MGEVLGENLVKFFFPAAPLKVANNNLKIDSTSACSQKYQALHKVFFQASELEKKTFVPGNNGDSLNLFPLRCVVLSFRFLLWRNV